MKIIDEQPSRYSLFEYFFSFSCGALFLIFVSVSLHNRPYNWNLLRSLNGTQFLKSQSNLRSFFVKLNNTFHVQIWRHACFNGISFPRAVEQFGYFIKSSSCFILLFYSTYILNYSPNLVSGTSKAHFVPFIIGPILEMSLVPQKELRKTIIPVFYDLIEIEAAKQPPTNQVN